MDASTQLIIAAAIVFFALIAIGRLIGWALGIREVRSKVEIQIKQNNQILDALDELIHIGKETGRAQGARFTEDFQKPPANPERDALKKDPRLKNQG